MAASDAAYQRRNRILSQSNRRLSTLSKPEYDDDTSEPPSSFVKEVLSSSKEHKRPVASAVPKPKVLSLNPSTTRRIAICNLVSYVLSFVLGCYVCYTLHVERVGKYCPLFVRALFSLFDAFGMGQMINKLFAAWSDAPIPAQRSVVKALTYGSVILNLYPIWSGMRKQGSSGQPAESEDKPESAEVSDSKNNDDDKSSGLMSDIDEEHLTMIASFVIRSGAACLVFGLLGYDGLYNVPVLLKFLR
ncbi:uncharacterized protein BXIN_2544 [Babesia sp. Xinjiang]|uniref:uncharacterized protein n=1 Tax=Babesia sp. Xinjiang TaxID=462227 RepID=UPI000A227819|nr:uncharacterized protein BXIN_2544 [Babesia sp. Xinjiang]ORM41454.1 hypothetical protein BXIN_2544 [Babesia sp. Xinjiang]